MQKIALLACWLLVIFFGGIFLLSSDIFFSDLGSGSTEIHFSSSATEKWVSLAIFAVLTAIIHVRHNLKFKIPPYILLCTLVTAMVWVIVCSHTFTISARENAFKDSWMFFETQRLDFNPTEDFSQFVVEKKLISFNLTNNQSNDSISILPISFFDHNRDQLLKSLNDFGVRNRD